MLHQTTQNSSSAIPSTISQNEQLLKAATSGNLIMLGDALSHGADINHTNEKGINILLIAAEHNQIAVMRYAVDHLGINPKSIDNQGKNALHVAALGGSIKAIQYATEVLKLPPKSTNNLGHNILHFAALNGHTAVMQYAVETLGIDSQSVGNEGKNALHVAALGGSIKAIQYATEILKIPPKSTDKFGHNALHFAALNGHTTAMQYAVDILGIGPQSVDNQGQNALHLAAYNGHITAMQYAVDTLRIDPQSVDNQGKNTLHMAALNGHIAAMQYAVDNLHIDPRSVNKNESNVLHIAAEFGHIPAIEYAVDTLGIDPRSVDNKSNNALHTAALNGHIAAMQYAVDNLHIDPRSVNKNGNNALHIAAEFGQIAAMQYAVDTLRIDPQSADNHGQNALHFAALNGHTAVMQYAVDHLGINPKSVDNHGQNTLHMAAFSGSIEAIQYAAEVLKLPPKSTNNLGHNILHFAALNGHTAVMQYAVETLGIDSQSVGNEGKNALHVAALGGSIKAIQYATEILKIPPKSTDKFGHNALHFAALNGHTTAMQYAVDILGIGPQSVDNQGQNALHIAALNGHIAAMKYAVDTLHIDPRSVNKNGSNALHIAAEFGHIPAMQYAVDILGIGPQSVDNQGKNALHTAALNGHITAMQYAVDNLHINPRSVTKNGNNALHIAAEFGHIAAMQYAVDTLHIDSLSVDNHGRNALHIAALKGRIAAMQYAVSNLHIDPNSLDNDGKNTLHLAATNPFLSLTDRIKAMQAAVELGTNPNAIDFSGQSVLDNIRLFIGNDDGDKIYTKAIQLGADKNLKGKDPRQSALHLSTLYSDLAAVKRALDLPPKDVNYRDDLGNTALHYAAEKEKIDIFLFLAEETDTNLTIKNIHGETPFDLALLNSNLSPILRELGEAAQYNFAQGNTSKAKKCFSYLYQNPTIFQKYLQLSEPSEELHQMFLFYLGDILPNIPAHETNLYLRLALETLAGKDANVNSPKTSYARKEELLLTLTILKKAQELEEAESLYTSLYNQLLHVFEVEDLDTYNAINFTIMFEQDLLLINTSTTINLLNQLLFLYCNLETFPDCYQTLSRAIQALQIQLLKTTNLQEAFKEQLLYLAALSLTTKPDFSLLVLMKLEPKYIYKEIEHWNKTQTRSNNNSGEAIPEAFLSPKFQVAAILAATLQMQSLKKNMYHPSLKETLLASNLPNPYSYALECLNLIKTIYPLKQPIVNEIEKQLLDLLKTKQKSNLATTSTCCMQTPGPQKITVSPNSSVSFFANSPINAFTRLAQELRNPNTQPKAEQELAKRALDGNASTVDKVANILRVNIGIYTEDNKLIYRSQNSATTEMRIKYTQRQQLPEAENKSTAASFNRQSLT